MDSLKRRLWYLSFAGFATLTTLILLLLPGHYVPSSHFAQQDKVEHAVLFAVLTWLWWEAGVSWWAVLVFAVCFAATTELLQAWLHWGRQGDIYDALADVTGATLAVLASLVRSRRR